MKKLPKAEGLKIEMSLFSTAKRMKTLAMTSKSFGSQTDGKLRVEIENKWSMTWLCPAKQICQLKVGTWLMKISIFH